MYIACGMDPKRATIFRQSDVAEHAYAGWLLTCVTPLGWLERMTQFKSKTQNRTDANREVSIGTGLLTYPCLQAADIVLYDADVVPTGEDQKQHLELCRDIVQRFNKLFGSNCLKAPRPMIQKSGSRIMGLDDPSAKMSKSTGERNQGHAIWLVDLPDTIVRKLRRAKTDLGSAVDIAQMSDGVSNLRRNLWYLRWTDSRVCASSFRRKTLFSSQARGCRCGYRDAPSDSAAVCRTDIRPRDARKNSSGWCFQGARPCRGNPDADAIRDGASVVFGLS